MLPGFCNLLLINEALKLQHSTLFLRWDDDPDTDWTGSLSDLLRDFGDTNLFEAATRAGLGWWTPDVEGETTLPTLTTVLLTVLSDLSTFAGRVWINDNCQMAVSKPGGAFEWPAGSADLEPREDGDPCMDCRSPVWYCTTQEQWFHVDPTHACFLTSGKEKPVAPSLIYPGSVYDYSCDCSVPGCQFHREPVPSASKPDALVLQLQVELQEAVDALRGLVALVGREPQAQVEEAWERAVLIVNLHATGN